MEGAHTIAGVKAKSRSMRSDSEAPSSGSTQGALLSILPFSDREHGVSSFAQVSELPCASKAPLALRGGPLVLPHTTGTRPLEVAPSRRRSPEEKGGWGGGGRGGRMSRPRRAALLAGLLAALLLALCAPAAANCNGNCWF